MIFQAIFLGLLFGPLLGACCAYEARIATAPQWVVVAMIPGVSLAVLAALMGFAILAPELWSTAWRALWEVSSSKPLCL